MTLAEWFKAAQAADIAERAKRICRPLRRSRTGQLKGQCIVHDGPDTLVGDVKKRIWKCLGCDESGGGAVSFVHYQFQLSHRETLAILLGLKRDGRAT